MPEGIESRIATHGGITFTCDTASQEVPLFLTGSPNLSVNGAIQNLVYGDNCTIKGFALSFPYQFGQGTIDAAGSSEPMFIQLGWRDISGNNGSVSEVGDTGLINIPDPNVWYDMDIFIPMPQTVDSKWQFEIIGLGGNVSMFNCPAGLDQAELDACFHLKISHTLALIG